MKNIYKLALLALCIIPGVIFGGKDKDKKKQDKQERRESESFYFGIKCPNVNCGAYQKIMWFPNKRYSVTCGTCSNQILVTTGGPLWRMGDTIVEPGSSYAKPNYFN